MIRARATMAEMSDGPPGIRDWTGYLLIKCGWWLQRMTEVALRELDLRDRHLMALTMLNTDDRMSQQELARHLSLDPTLVVALIDDLEERGLCERTRHADDRRRHMIQLTTKGRRVYRDARALAVKVGDEIFAPLERSERAQLTEMLKRIMGPLWLKPK
jgi:DNA-binding MarR family transcriptional regulator